jgi:hypothetical protein
LKKKKFKVLKNLKKVKSLKQCKEKKIKAQNPRPQVIRLRINNKKFKSH